MIIGIAGHVNHGKTSLLKALTGIDGDRLPEEKRRGLTIEPEYIRTKFLGDDVFFIDVPGHEHFVRAMLAASVGVDVALYAVDVCEGIMPQTEEHSFILGTLGVKGVVVVLTKSDKADSALITRREKEASDFFLERGIEDIKIVPVSIYDERSLCELKKVLAKITINECRHKNKPFRLYVDRCFSVKGAGTIVTGSSTRGKVCVGEMLYTYPSGVVARVKRIEKGGTAYESAESGRIALNLSGVAISDVPRGSVLYYEGGYELSRRFAATLLIRGGWRLKNNGIYNMFIGASKLRARYLEKISEFVLERSFPLDVGDVFFIRGASPETTIAGGTVLSIYKERERGELRKINKQKIVRDADTESFMTALKVAWGCCAAGNIALSCGMGTESFNATMKRLVAEEKIVTLENYIITKQLFDEYTALVRRIIDDDGYADIASFKKASGLSRNIAAALLDKGDRLMLWKNEGDKRKAIY